MQHLLKNNLSLNNLATNNVNNMWFAIRKNGVKA